VDCDFNNLRRAWNPSGAPGLSYPERRDAERVREEFLDPWVEDDGREELFTHGGDGLARQGLLDDVRQYRNHRQATVVDLLGLHVLDGERRHAPTRFKGSKP